MLELEGCGSPIAGTGQDGKGNEGSITTLYFGRGGHYGDDVSDLLQRRHSLVPVGLGDSCLFGRLVVVDDVITTGATAEACARVLKRAGASRVDILALARAVEPSALLLSSGICVAIHLLTLKGRKAEAEELR
jgi:hypothetical protein